jgi:hypothetical protein
LLKPTTQREVDFYRKMIENGHELSRHIPVFVGVVNLGLLSVICLTLG